MKLDYLLLDVFTTKPLTGNQLAVVLHADDLLDNQMQSIAREFSLSEVVFLTKPKQERIVAGVRIFTATMELPFAGHPTIGAAVVLALQHRLSAVRMEELVGTITCVVDRVDRHTAHARFALPQLPEEVGKAPDKASIALALGVNQEDIGAAGFQPSCYSAGVPFYLIPLRNAQVLTRIQLNFGNWAKHFPLGNHSVYCFAPTPDEPGVDFGARMFSPGIGSGEDAGTGAAAAALIGLLAKQVDFDDGQAEYQIRQGYEMGRPCHISVQLKKEGGKLTHGGIGGSAVIVGQGALELPDTI